MNTITHVPLIDHTVINDLLQACDFATPVTLKHELWALWIDTLGVPFDHLELSDFQLLKKYIHKIVFGDMWFNDNRQKNKALELLDQNDIRALSKDIQSYIDRYWRPTYTMMTLWKLCQKKTQNIDWFTPQELQKLLYPLTVSFQYTFEDEADELHLLQVVDTARRGFTRIYPFNTKTWDGYQYAKDFEEELQYQINNAFEGVNLYEYTNFERTITEYKAQWAWWASFITWFLGQHARLVESILHRYVWSHSPLIQSLGKYKIAVAASIILIIAQSQFKQSPDASFSLERVVNKEVTLDKETQQKIDETVATIEETLPQPNTTDQQKTHTQTKQETASALSDTIQVQAPSLGEKISAAVRDVFIPQSLPTKKVGELKSTSINHRDVIMKKEVIGDFEIYKDPFSTVYFRKVKSGQTLGEVHRALQNDSRFAYLKNDSYDPSKSWNVFGWNIKSGVLQPWMLVPVPLDRAETIVSQKELIQASMDAVDAIKSHPKYGEFVTTLENDLGRNHLMKLMLVFADKESDMGNTQLHRFEPHHDAYSYSLFHILDEWPGHDALEWLWLTEADVMSDPTKAGQRFRAFWFEKFHDLKNNKNFGKYYDNPSKFFAKKNLKTCGKLYNGSASYGTALKTKWKTLFEQ